MLRIISSVWNSPAGMMSTPPPRTRAVTSWLWKAGRVGVSTIVQASYRRRSAGARRRTFGRRASIPLSCHDGCSVRVAVCLMLAACSRTSTPGELPAPAILRVTVVAAEGRAAYLDGSARYLRMTGPAVDTHLRLNEGDPTAISLPGGSYRLESWARPCTRGCGSLDAPTDRCTGTFPLAGGDTTVIETTASPGRPCSFAVIPSSAPQ